jgi:flagellar hook-length control protein FliK
VQLTASGTTGLPIDVSKQHQTIPPEAGATAEEQQHSRQQATEEQAQEPMMQTAQAEQDEGSLSAKNIQFHQPEKTNPGKPGLNEQEFTARIGSIAEATSPPTGALPGVLSGESATTTTAPVAHGAPPARQLLDVSNPLPIREETMQEAYFRRSEQNQIAADKLAEAIGQRLSAQIEKGIWQVNLQLRPAHLGKIDIRLTMQGKGNISAEFSASEVQTKDLLNSGLPRLREIFAQSGIDLATMQAKHDAATGHSDNPAPRQPATPASQGQPSRETVGETVARPQAPPKLDYVGRDGLDITV